MITSEIFNKGSLTMVETVIDKIKSTVSWMGPYSKSMSGCRNSMSKGGKVEKCGEEEMWHSWKQQKERIGGQMLDKLEIMWDIWGGIEYGELWVLTKTLWF